jgi:hypothetical protein
MEGAVQLVFLVIYSRKNNLSIQAGLCDRPESALQLPSHGPKPKCPPMSSGGRRSHKSETRISAIADFAREGKREKKALPSFLCLRLRSRR